VIPRSVVVGRRLAAAGLAISTLVVVALVVFLGVWWATGSPPFSVPGGAASSSSTR